MGMWRGFWQWSWWLKAPALLFAAVIAFAILSTILTAAGVIEEDKPLKLTADEQAFVEALSTMEAREETISTLEAIAAVATEAARPTNTPPPPATETPLPYKLSLISGSCTTRKDIGFIECEGFVENISGVSMTNVEAVVIYTSGGTSVSSDSALIDYSPILPGQQSPFSTIGRYNPAFDGWRVEFKEFLGGTILTRDDRP